MTSKRWLRAATRWIGGWIRFRGTALGREAAPGLGRPAAIEPHPRMETDRGEREQIEGLMEAHSRHVGRRP